MRRHLQPANSDIDLRALLKKVGLFGGNFGWWPSQTNYLTKNTEPQHKGDRKADA